ncbi:hypothetical protein FQN60_013677 [Etheostoma spectabile]|uniref:Uncharacterized protein n=1 Tax=Etheostoma spectabile TaxID=54343 RepID=A0A5J5CJ71_9PERO|nr:hypothetical protein FQN60_013677 [Etheostoma spectabile]
MLPHRHCLPKSVLMFLVCQEPPQGAVR